MERGIVNMGYMRHHVIIVTTSDIEVLISVRDKIKCIAVGRLPVSGIMKGDR